MSIWNCDVHPSLCFLCSKHMVMAPQLEAELVRTWVPKLDFPYSEKRKKKMLWVFFFFFFW